MKCSAPGPGHSAGDRSLSIRLTPAPDGFVAHSLAGDDALTCKDYAPRARRAAAMGANASAQGRQHRAHVRSGTQARCEGRQRVSDLRLPASRWHARICAWCVPASSSRTGTAAPGSRGAPKDRRSPIDCPSFWRPTTTTVLIVEGEKDADNLAALGFTATTNPRRAGKFTAELAGLLQGKETSTFCRTMTRPGAAMRRQVAADVAGVAKSVRIVDIPGLPDKGDVSDWLSAGGTTDQLANLLRTAPELIAAAPLQLVKSSAEFVRGFVPPDYAIDGLIQRRFLYSLTAPTGHGKTAVALLVDGVQGARARYRQPRGRRGSSAVPRRARTRTT